ncbi:hypothetical protein MA16_Dca015614 [Dendrobium catenatum]|uniref:Secreted protein n=1 Tax=Dendrobium catenatum TaxID=906689 RepID=A0A2I0WJ96_9ASPA|nr:hypothetical protein MA16_Dca015614 [Dendrobium catenatum]
MLAKMINTTLLGLLVESLGFQLRGPRFESMCMRCVREFALIGLNVPKKKMIKNENQQRRSKRFASAKRN